jgi:hypothetical protein
MKPYKCAAMNLEETFYVTNLIFQEKGREKEGKRKGKGNLMRVIQPLWTPWIKNMQKSCTPDQKNCLPFK